jgi:hypothetical protein
VPYHGRITQNWTPFNAAWKSLETFAIPPAADQPTNSAYNAGKPATYAAEYASPAQYPSTLDSSVPAPTFTYHRFWAQAEIATAFATHDELFGS